LRVNGKIPVEKWLPFPTMSAKNVLVESEDFENLDWDKKRGGRRIDYPKEKVENVKAEGIKRWTVKFKPKAR
jgi:hypothetical protein